MLRPSPNHEKRRLPNDDDDDEHQMVILQNKYGSSISHKTPTDTMLYCPKSPPLVWPFTPVTVPSSCHHHLPLQPKHGGMVMTI